jgi:uncharacterized protein GlcG (DUF336 family)
VLLAQAHECYGRLVAFGEMRVVVSTRAAQFIDAIGISGAPSSQDAQVASATITDAPSALGRASWRDTVLVLLPRSC